MDPYHVSEGATLSNSEKADYLKLDWNEPTVPPSPLVKDRLREAVEEGHFEYYPDVSAADLCHSIGDYLGVCPDNILVFNGSDSAIRTVLDTYVTEGRTVATREPVYTQPYTFVRTNAGDISAFTTSNPFGKDLSEIEARLSEEMPSVLYLPNPNNPTGVKYEPDEVESLLSSFPETLFVVDEAYMEFTDGSVVGLTKTYDNLIVSRTFSKAFGLASLRIGYIVTHPDVLVQLEKVRNGKSVNLLGQLAATAALNDLAHLERHTGRIEENQRWTVNKLLETGVTTRRTPANFFLVRVPEPSRITELLRQRGILIRNRSNLPQLDGYCRVSVGTREQMERFVDELLSLDENLIQFDS